MNIDSLSTSQLYSSSSNSTSQSLASGQKINSAADNPAGQALVTAFTAQITSQDMGVRNANDGIALLQTADGASDLITQSLQRMSELGTQAMNGTLNSSQRSMLNNEFQQNLQNISQIAGTTSFNDQMLLNGDNPTVNIALGSEANSTLNLPTLTTDSLSLTGLSITNPADAATAMEGIGLAMEQLSSARSEFGAQQNDLTRSVENMQNQNIATYSSRSQISDTDFAKAIAEQSRQNILNQSAIAMQSQGNQSKAAVLQLLT